MQVYTHLWFEKEVEEAVRFYVETVPGSRIDRVAVMQSESPSGPPGSVTVIDFTLGGAHFQAMEAGPLDPFNHAVSIVIDCDTQEQIDGIWRAILDNGGSEEQCGWIRDRWGVCWQIVPTFLSDSLGDSDKARSKRISDAMLKMVKMDIATLQRAAAGETE